MSANRTWGDLKSRAWYRELRARMVEGLEPCRMCGGGRRHESVEAGGLRLGHIRARTLGGTNALANLTIVCERCDQQMGERDWAGVAPSVLDDEWTPPWGRPRQSELRPAPLTQPLALPDWLRDLAQ